MAPMTQTPNSKRIACYGYDAASQTLSVMFKNSAFRYDYAAVPPEVAAELDKADSKGSFIVRQIVQGGFTFEKVDTAAEDAEAQPAAA